jgi:serine phosphatase RsbU (regulator of sigma subunit)
MSAFTRSGSPKMMSISLPSSRGQIVGAIVLGLVVPLVGFSAWYLASHDLVIEDGSDLIVPLSVVGAMLVLSGVVGWLLHGAARRAVNRVRVESALTLDRQVVVRMQRALLPTQLPQVDGVELEVRYHPGGLGATGGDFYSAVALDGGRIGLAVGEVDGDGVQAAARMAEITFTLRNIASQGHEPGKVLELLNEHLHVAADDTAPIRVSAVYGILDPATDRWEQAIAGHCPPLVRSDEGSVRTLDEGLSPPLGIDPNATFDSTSVDLGSGSTLLLYTDGLLSRAGMIDARDFKRLGGALKVLEEDLTDAVDRVVRLMVGEAGAEDAVVVAARVHAPVEVSTPG